jgi:hypothetical protein
MKKLAALLLLFSTVAFAGNIKLGDLPLGDAASISSTDSFPYTDTTTKTTRRLLFSDLKDVPALSSSFSPALTFNAPLSLTANSVSISAFTSTNMGAVPASGGGTTNYLRADGTWSPIGDAGLTFTAPLTDTSGTIAISNFSSSVKGAVPASGGGAAKFLRSDATFSSSLGGGSSSLLLGLTPDLSINVADNAEHVFAIKSSGVESEIYNSDPSFNADYPHGRLGIVTSTATPIYLGVGGTWQPIYIDDNTGTTFIGRPLGSEPAANQHLYSSPALSVDGAQGGSNTDILRVRDNARLPLFSVGGELATGYVHSFVPMDMGSMKISSLANPSSAQDAATKFYVDAETTRAEAAESANTTAIAAKLPLSGGTMTGTITMGAHALTGLPTPSSASDAATKTYVDSAVKLVEALTGMIETPSDKTYVIDQSAAYPYTINTLVAATASGTLTGKIQINGVDVTGISALSISSTPATGTASAANSVSVGNKVTLVVSGSSTPADLSFTMKVTRQ